MREAVVCAQLSNVQLECLCIQEIFLPIRKPWRKILITSLTTFVFKSNTCKKWQIVKAIPLKINDVIYKFFSDLALTYLPTCEKAYVAWSLGGKVLEKNVARTEKDPLHIPSLSQNPCRNISIISPQACITLALILEVFVCGCQFHEPVGTGNNYRKELYIWPRRKNWLVKWMWQEPGKKIILIYISHFYVLISMTISFKQSISIPPKSIWVFVRAPFLI